MGGHQVESLSCVNLRVHECLEGMKIAELERNAQT